MTRLEGTDHELFRQLFDVAPDPILIIDGTGTIVLANEETGRKFGYSAAELVGQKMEILVPERFRANHIHYRQGYCESPALRPMGTGRELYARKYDGTEFPVEISLSPLKSQSISLVIGIIRDITDRKITEKELQRANLELARSNSELEEFAYIASHDLQEPLRSVAGACQLLRRRYKDKLDPSAHEFIDFAVAGTKRMEELINDLLAYSRVATKGKDPELSNLNQVLKTVTDNLRSSISSTNAVITADNLPIIAVDPWQITQLFQNIIANALKFRRDETPEIHVSAKSEDNHWHFAIKDNGIGIDPKYFDRIFEVFKRLHNQDRYPGTGIGLASCKKIVERHGGRIWVESEIGQGTTFHFTIPMGTKELHELKTQRNIV